jgi:hypothetical protein
MTSLKSRLAAAARRLALPALLALAACSPGGGAPPRTIVLAECRLPGVDTAARCGTYEVWENRRAASGRRIKLNLAVVGARLPHRDADPIVVFGGGPG